MDPPSSQSQPDLRHEARRLRNLIFFRSPAFWRWWPFLPVVRPVPGGKGQQCGVMYDARGMSGTYGYSATIFITNLFFLPQTEAEFLALPKQIYDTAEEVADAGWSVD